jgi:hypothetical protein
MSKITETMNDRRYPFGAGRYDPVGICDDFKQRLQSLMILNKYGVCRLSENSIF